MLKCYIAFLGDEKAVLPCFSVRFELEFSRNIRQILVAALTYILAPLPHSSWRPTQ